MLSCNSRKYKKVGTGKLRETIVHKLVDVLRQPAYLHPVCDFNCLKVLPPREKKKTHQLSDASIATKQRSEKSLVMHVDIVKTSLLFTSIHVLSYITMTCRSKLLMHLKLRVTTWCNKNIFKWKNLLIYNQFDMVSF